MLTDGSFSSLQMVDREDAIECLVPTARRVRQMSDQASTGRLQARFAVKRVVCRVDEITGHVAFTWTDDDPCIFRESRRGVSVNRCVCVKCTLQNGQGLAV